MPIETLINAVKRWALDTFPLGGDTWHTATVSLTDDGMSFVGDVPSPHNDGGDALTLTVDASGTWAEAAEAGKLSMRFGDGSEAPVAGGKCYVPRDAMVLGGDELTVQAVARVMVDGSLVADASNQGANSGSSWVQLSGNAIWMVTGSPNLDLFKPIAPNVEYEMRVGGLVFRDKFVQVNSTRLRMGNQEAGNTIPSDAEIPYYIEVTLNSSGNVSQAKVTMGPSVASTGTDAFELRTAPVEAKTVSNTLTVPLQHGEPGMFAVVGKADDEIVVPVITYPELEYDREDKCNTWWNTNFAPTYEVGETYVVTFNGKDYTCVCKEHEGRRIIGNPTVLGGYDDGTFNGEEPFVVLENERAFYGGIYDVTVFECSVGVRKLGDKTVKHLSDAFKEIEERTTVTLAGKVVDEATVVGQAQLAYTGYTEGMEYSVEFDGTEYVCRCKAVDVMGTPALYLGNLAVGIEFDMPVENAEDTGEPFLIVYVSAMGMVMAMTPGIDEHSCKISTTKNVMSVGEAVPDIESRVSTLESVGSGVPMFVFDQATQRYKIVGISVEKLFAAYLAMSTPPVMKIDFHRNQQYWDTPKSAVGLNDGGNDWNGSGTPYSIMFYYGEDGSEYINIRQDGVTSDNNNPEWPN